jgi:hypothetical protein
MLAAPLATRPRTVTASCRNLASLRRKPVAERPQLIAAAANWLVAAAICKVGLDGGDGTDEIGDGRGQLILRHR